MLCSPALPPLSSVRLTSSDRRRVGLLAAAALVMLPGFTMVRMLAPSPFAPRVHVRWSDGVSDAQRVELERRFSLTEGHRREAATWEYDLVDVNPASVLELIANPSVADTHYLDRTSGTVAADAPAGRVRLADRRVAGLIHSPLFDWLMFLSVSSLIVASVCLASAGNPRQS